MPPRKKANPKEARIDIGISYDEKELVDEIAYSGYDNNVSAFVREAIWEKIQRESWLSRTNKGRAMSQVKIDFRAAENLPPGDPEEV